METARRAVDGSGFVDQLAPGDWVSLHWDWVCDRLSPRQLADLRRYFLRQLEITNHEVAHSGPATVLSLAEILNPQQVRGQAKLYQVRQLLRDQRRTKCLNSRFGAVEACQ